jgi:putative transposase
MSNIELHSNTPISLNGNAGVVRFADEDIILMSFESGKTQTVRPKEFRDWLRAGKLKIARRKETTLLKVFKNESEQEKYLFVKECVDRMDMHPTPYARDVVNKILVEVACKLGWPGGNKFGDSTMISYYNNWTKEGRDYNYMLTKPTVKRKVKKISLKYTIAEVVFQRYYMKKNGPTETDTLRLYRETFHKEVELTRAQFGDDSANALGKPLSKTSFNNYIRSFDPYEVMKARKGTKAALRHFRQKGTANLTSFPLERVEVDALHLQIGLKVRDVTTGKDKVYKPIIYIAMDVHTRLVIGYHISVSEKASETSNAVVQLIKHMVDPFKETMTSKSKWPLSGAPEEIFSDCGSAFTARWVRSIMATIGATHHMCPAASPWKKGFVERFNGTIKMQYAPQMTGYVGNRNRGDVMDGTIESLAVLTKDQFISEFERYILDYYHHNPHRGLDNESPLKFFEKVKHLALSTSLELRFKLDGYAGWHKEVNLTDTGIQYKNLRYYSNDLRSLRDYLVTTEQLRGKHPKVTAVINNSDVSQISVVDERDNELLVIPCQSQNVEEDCYRFEYDASRKTQQKSTASGNTSSKSPPNLHNLDEELSDDEVTSIIKNGAGIGERDYSSYKRQDDSNQNDADFDNDDIPGDFAEY